MSKPRLHQALLALLTLALASVLSGASFDIPAQPAPSALKLFTKQSGSEVVYLLDDLKSVTTKSVQGDLTPADALSRLLAGTGFTAEPTGSGNFAISRISNRPGSIEGLVRAENGRGVEGAKVLLAGSDRFVFTDKRGRFTLEEVPPGDHSLQIAADGMQKTHVTDIIVRPGHRHTLSTIAIPVVKEGVNEMEAYVVSAKKNDGVIELDPYSVEGYRPRPFSTANLDLTRTRDDALPFQTFSAKDIELSGAATLHEFFNSRLTQNSNPDLIDEINGEGAWNNGFGQNQVNLRGWGARETVLLLNGRRMPPEYQAEATDGGNAMANLNGIPVASIERIEILPAAGSAIYGANATGGVINIITKRDYKGGQLSVSYESPADVHRPTRSATLYYGLPLRGNFSLRVTGSYNERHPLEAGDRSDITIERWRRITMQNAPENLMRSVGGNPLFTSTSPSSVRGATPNIRAVSSTGNLFASLSGSPASNFTTVPSGYTGGGGLAVFSPGAWNLDIGEGAAGSSLWAKGSTLGTRNTTVAWNLGVDKNFNEDWQLSVDARYSKHQQNGQIQGSLAFVGAGTGGTGPRVPAAAPTNPFGQDVQVSLIDPYLHAADLENKPTDVTWSLSSTLRGKVKDWSGFVDIVFTQNENRFPSNTIYEPIGGWRAAFLSGAYNPFVDLRVTAPASPDFYRNFVIRRFLYESATRTYQASAKASGPIWEFPAGPLNFTGGIEGQKVDRFKSTFFGQYQERISGNPIIPFGGFQVWSNLPNADQYRNFKLDNYAAYGEMTLPLIGNKWRLPLVSSLELFGSFRYDTSTDYGFQFGTNLPQKFSHTTNMYAWGSRLKLNESVLLRVSQSNGYIPPSISQRTPGAPPEFDYPGLTDPKRSEPLDLAPGMWTWGGRPELKPETTDSTNIGVIITPQRIPDLRISVDFLQNVRNDAITSIDGQVVVDLEDAIPVVTRGPVDGHPSGVGPIAFVDMRVINLFEINTRAVDVSIDHQIRDVLGGRFSIGLTATRNVSFKVQVLANEPAVEQIRNPDGVMSQQIKWNAVGRARWERGAWGFGWNARYYDYILVPAFAWAHQGSDRAPSEINHDFNLSYRRGIGRNWFLSEATINLGLKNAFNREPRFWAESSHRGVAPYDSIAGRTIWLQIRKDL